MYDEALLVVRRTPREARTTGRYHHGDDEVAVTQLSEHDGPHHLPYSEQERCAVEGCRIDGSGQCNVVAIATGNGEAGCSTRTAWRVSAC